VTCVVKNARWPLAALLAVIPVLTFAAGPYLFQETFDDGSLDGAAHVAGEWVVESGAPVISASSQQARRSLLELARVGSPSEIRQLIQSGVSPDSREGGGITAMHVAAAACRADNVDELLRVRAMVSPRAEDGLTPLMLAAQVGCDAVVRQLLAAGADPSSINDRGETAFVYAMTRGHKALAESLRVKSELSEAVLFTLKSSCASLVAFFDGVSSSPRQDNSTRFEHASFVFGTEKPIVLRDDESVSLLFTDLSEDALRSSLEACKNTNAARFTSGRRRSGNRVSVGGTFLQRADGTTIGKVWIDGKRRYFDSARNEWIAAQSTLVLSLEP
jgi:hypothetical protein